MRKNIFALSAAFLALFFSLPAFSQEITIKNLKGKEIAPFAKEIAAFADSMYQQASCYFSEAEWDGYIQSYSNTPEAVISLALANGKIVGAAIGTPLTKASEKYRKPFFDRPQELNSLYFLADFPVKPEYRNEQVVEKLYKEFEHTVAAKKQFSGICQWYLQLEKPSWEIPFFQKLGYSCFPEIHFDEFYKESAQDKEVTAHTMVCWKKLLS
jgi:hypothetical protein